MAVVSLVTYVEWGCTGDGLNARETFFYLAHCKKALLSLVADPRRGFDKISRMLFPVATAA